MTTIKIPDRLFIKCGDAIEVMRARADCSIDSIVTDPDYSLIVNPAITQWGGVPGLDWATECLRVLKPGGHLLAFGATRTWHRLAVVIEDAGFELRDSIAWLYGGGFPKSHNISKAIDKAKGVTREAIGMVPSRLPTAQAGWGNAGVDSFRDSHKGTSLMAITSPATDAARTWDGWGTALKPAFEPIIVARKPLNGTVAANVLAHGTGGLNIDTCRVETTDERRRNSRADTNGLANGGSFSIRERRADEIPSTSGRWPANVVLDDSTARELDEQTGTLKSGMMRAGTTRLERDGQVYGKIRNHATESDTYADSGGASRFFYVAKAPQRERPRDGDLGHPTVKPVTLLRWLVKLVTPPGGTVMDPFIGSGTTAEAALLEGFRCYGIEIHEPYMGLIRQRLLRAGLLDGTA